MRKLMITGVLLILSSGLAFSQTRREPVGWLCFFAGGGGISGSGPTVTFFGEETTFRIYKGFGAGLEEDPSWDFSSGSLISFSANLSYHFRRSEKVEPFITGGYSTVFRKGTREDGGDFGGGSHFWFSDHLGLYTAFHNQIFTGPARDFYGFQLGIAMR
jgi:hypothetical protein